MKADNQGAAAMPQVADGLERLGLGQAAPCSLQRAVPRIWPVARADQAHLWRSVNGTRHSVTSITLTATRPRQRRHKVRYSGLWHHSRRDHAARARQLLALDRSEAPGPKQGAVNPAATGKDCSAASPSSEPRRCPCCKVGHLDYVRKLYPKQVRGP
jgi:hypothetical protein